MGVEAREAERRTMTEVDIEDVPLTQIEEMISVDGRMNHE